MAKYIAAGGDVDIRLPSLPFERCIVDDRNVKA